MGNVPRLLLAKMGGILGFAMEMTRRGSVAIPKPEILNRNPRRLETRTQRGFPTFPQRRRLRTLFSDEDKPR